MKFKIQQPLWTILVPVCAWILFAGNEVISGGFYTMLMAVALIGSVLAAVHHAHVVALRVGEPFGALVLAIAVTAIEVALIISLMLTHGHDTSTLCRDAVFAAEMIIITGIVGGSLLLGGIRFKEQTLGLDGVNASITVLTAISVLTLVLPNYTDTIPGPFYSNHQLAFVAAVSLLLYFVFLLVQTTRHRTYFMEKEPEAEHGHKPTNKSTYISLVLLVISLAAVVGLAEHLAPGLETSLDKMGAPKSLVGVIIAMVVLLPEGISAFSAASHNQLQSSLNLSLGSALASVGLTIPAVAFFSLAKGLPLELGIDIKSTVLFVLSLYVILLTLRTGRTTLLQGLVLLVIFAVYLFTTVVP